ncbi:nSTAND1 domain-containing NTPase [Agromyces binzhouensis]|uniref:nSTAND1 domain-containing NTPase n=1 Tax=Agromyces binzhouensis TaxID=1817495 RepID=UPI00363D5D25
MGIRVFGPLRLDGFSLSPRERIVLTALVLRAGRPMTTDELADAVWRDAPPETWPKQLQASVGRIRSALGRDAIETRPGGYTLRIDPDSVDAERFERFASSAEEHLEGDDPARAVDAADRAFALWQGSPYTDLADWAPAVVEAERLREVRMGLEEVRLAARLRLGEHAASVAEAERLVREAPLRERRWTMLATALYRSGRQADALAAIRTAKERLAADLGAEPGHELREVEIAVLRHDDSLELGDAPRPPSDACPYRGLAPFGVEDEDDFFGRASDTTAALARLARSRFLAVSGASGSGKSSLVRAGLIPALRRRGDRVVLLIPERDLDVHVRDALWGARRADVIVIDQFEEVFHVGEADVDAAASAIAEAAACGTTVVLVVRSDFLDDCAAHPDLAPLVAEGVHLVGPMAPDALREAIEQPARRAGLRLEPGLVELLLRDAAGEAGALPHLSHALVETWLRREGGTLTVAGYEASGGISGAIAQSADRLYQSMDAEQRALCRSVLLRLVALAPDGTPVRRRVPSRPLRSDAARDDVLTLLSRDRLISAEAESVEVAHESLATAWPRLQSWLAEDAESTRLLNAVTAASEAWAAAGRPDDDLYRGARLQSALEWRDAAHRDLTDVEVAFLDESAARATAERDELAERARRDRRQNRGLRALLAGAIGLIMLLVGVGSVAVVASREASAQRDNATIEALVATALSLSSRERDVSALLAAEAYRRWPDDPRTRSGLMGVLQHAGGFMGNAYVDEAPVPGAVVPGTETALVATPDGGISIRDLETGAVVRAFDAPTPAPFIGRPVPLAGVSDDGRVGVVLRPVEAESAGPFDRDVVSSELVALDLASGEPVLGPEPVQIGNGALAVAPDGSTIAIADDRDGSIAIVRTDTGTERRLPARSTESSTSLLFAADDRLLVGGPGAEVRIVDVTTATIVDSVPVPEYTANLALTISSSGTLIASGDAGVIAYGLGEQRLLWRNDGLPSPCNSVAVSEEVGRVYCAGWAGLIPQLDLADGTAFESDLTSLLGDTGPLFITDGGTTLVAMLVHSGVIARWSLAGDGPARRLLAPGELALTDYGRTESTIVTAPPGTGDTTASGSWSDAVVRDSSTGEIRYRFDAPLSDVTWIADDRLMMRFSGEDEWRVIEPDGSSAPAPWQGDWFWLIDAGTRMVTRTDAPSISVLDARTFEPIGDPIDIGGMPAWASAAPDGSRLGITYFTDDATMIDGEVSPFRLAIVDPATSEILADERVPFGAFILIGDGQLIGMNDDRVDRYGIDPIEKIGTLPGTAGGLGSPTLSDDGRTLLVSAGDGSRMLYDLPSGVRLGEPITGGTGSTGMLRPDGREMAITMPEGVIVWDLDPERQFAAVCRIAGRNLTPQEWSTYLADFGAPENTCGFDD